MATGWVLLESCRGVGSVSGSDQSRGLDAEFERFAMRASPWLLRSAYLLTGDRGHAEDLLQLTLWRTARRWRAIRGSPEAYAREVLVNLSRDRRRALSRRPVEVAQADLLIPGSADDVGRLLERDAMIGAVRGLPRRQREVVVLRFFLGLSVEQTAAALDASQGTVKSYTARALARMRDLLGENPPASLVSSEVPNAD
jgi:RNA polymerase sigma-70 factor (sigma-E family)